MKLNKLNSEQKRLVEENHNLIYTVLLQYNLSVAEYYCEAAEGLCQAALSYKNPKVKFSAYAYVCIKNNLSKFIRIQKYQKRNSGKDDLYYEDIAFEDVSFIELFGNDYLFTDYNYQLLKLRLTDREKEVLNLLLNKYTLTEIGDMYNVTKSQITLIRQSIQKKYLKW